MSPAPFRFTISHPLLILMRLGVVSMLLLTTANAEDLIPRNAVWSYLKGTNEASSPDNTAWRQPGFNDASWPTGPVPVFYGEPLTGTEVPDMRGLYTSIYFRKIFVVTNVQEVETLTLQAVSDDGFVAWINGIEIARFNAPAGELTHASTALTTFTEPLPFESYPIPIPSSVLRPGTNVLAVHGLNVSLSGSSDFVFDPALEFTRDTTAPVVDRILPAAGAVVRSFASVEILFSEPVNGVDAADLLINGQPANTVSEVGAGQFIFSFTQPLPGPVTVRFRDGHGITDRAPVPHPFAGASWTFTLDPSLAAPGVQLNEFLADNKRGLRDADGDTPDWIEIHNPSTETVSLSGWTLSDDPLAPAKWRIGSATLQPSSFLLIFASGKNRTNALGELHTNFKLSSDAGGYLALFDASGKLVSAFTNYPAQQQDVSYGRAGGAPNRVGYFTSPTPRAPNSETGAGFAPPVLFSQASRTYRTSLQLRLSTTNTAAIIRYTTDGSIPTEASPSFGADLDLTTAVQIRARSFQANLLPGPVRSETFIPLSDPVYSFTSDLPVMIIHDFGKGRPPANTDTFAHIQLFEPDTNGVTSLTNLPTLSGRSVIAARGSSTEGYAKVSLKVEFQDELGFGRNVPLLGLPSESDWVLYAPNNFEPILIHNPLAYQLSRDIGRYAPRTRFVEVYLVQSGNGAVASTTYNGIYVLEEKIKLGKDRVDAPSLNPGQNTLPDVTGGYLLKIDRPDPGDSGFFSGSQSVLYVDPKESELRLPERSGQRTYINSYLTQFDTALNGAGFRNPTNGYRAYIATPAWIDHHLLNVLTFNVDALRLSAYLYKQRDGKLHFGPVWDFDRTLYSTDGRDANPRVWRSPTGDQGTDFFNYTWWNRLFLDPDFFQDYIDRYQELRGTTFATTNLAARVDFFCNQVRKAQPREQAKWGISPRGGYQGEIDSLKRWLSNRVEFMDSQFVRPPAFAEGGATVASGHLITLTGPANASLYYTLDGTDPRATGSTTGTNLAPAAILYTAPFPITANARIVVRSRNPAHTALTGLNNPPLKSIWSGPVAQTFVVQPIPLLITEIMYHPRSDGPSGFGAADFEFIELLNRGGSPLDLTGIRIGGDINFEFSSTNPVHTLAPGARLVVVANPAAFVSRYPAVTNVGGTFSGSLGNGGGHLTLHGRLLEPILDLRFTDTTATNTDGGGRSLVLTDESLPISDVNTTNRWRASARDGGSPGAPEPSTSSGPILTLTATPLSIGIQVDAVPGKIYRLEATDQLPGNTWQLLERSTPATSPILRFTQPLPPRQRFYRVGME